MEEWEKKLTKAKKLLDDGFMQADEFERIRTKALSEMGLLAAPISLEKFRPKESSLSQQKISLHKERNKSAAQSLSGPTFVQPSEMTPSAGESYVPFDCLPAGTKVGDYLIVESIEEGGMGMVYRGRHMIEDFAVHGGDVAIKFMKNSFASKPEFTKRFLREAGVGRRLHHKNIAKCLGVVEFHGQLALVMEYIEGQSLRAFLDERATRLSVEQVVKILLPIAKALDYLHSEGFVHRDIKPKNIQLHPKRGAVLLDFGISKNILQDADQSSVAIGSPIYMSPEQLDAKYVSKASDQYSLALVVYEMLTQGLPWGDISRSRIDVVKLTDCLLPLVDKDPSFGKSVSEALQFALRYEPSQRYENCQIFIKTLFNAKKAKVTPKSPQQKADNSSETIQQEQSDSAASRVHTNPPEADRDPSPSSNETTQPMKVIPPIDPPDTTRLSPTSQKQQQIAQELDRFHSEVRPQPQSSPGNHPYLKPVLFAVLALMIAYGGHQYSLRSKAAELRALVSFFGFEVDIPKPWFYSSQQLEQWQQQVAQWESLDGVSVERIKAYSTKHLTATSTQRAAVVGKKLYRKSECWGYCLERKQMRLQKEFQEVTKETLYLPGISQLNTNGARTLLCAPDIMHLIFPDQTSLTPDVAKELAFWSGTELSLPALKKLEPSTARELAQWPKSQNHTGSEKCRHRLIPTIKDQDKKRLYLAGASDITPAAIKELAAFSGEVLSLGGLTQLTPALALELSNWQGEELYLNGLQELDATTAEALAQWQGTALSFNGLQNLSPEAAQQLAKWKGSTLHLNGLQQLDEKTVAELAKWHQQSVKRPRVWISLDGITQLNVDTARVLGSLDLEYLSLASIQTIEPEAAEQLAQWKVRMLSLRGIQELSPEQAQALTRWQGTNLLLDGLTTLTPPVAQTLAGWKGTGLSFDSLQSLPPEVAQKLASWKGKKIYLNGLQQLSPETAQQIAQWKVSNLYANALTVLDPVAATALSKWQGTTLRLDGLTSINPETAKGLGEWQGRYLYLGGITRIDEKSAAALLHESQNKRSTFPLFNLQVLTPEVAKQLAKWPNSTMRLDQLEQLDGPTAESLSSWKGSYLSLNGLQQLPPEAARGLVSWSGRTLSLNGLDSLSTEAAHALANSKLSSLHLNTLRAMDSQTAEALSKWKGSRLSLNGLIILTPVTAKALAGWGGRRLSLNGLSALSAATAESLSTWSGTNLSFDGLQTMKMDTAYQLAKWSGKSLSFDSLATLDSATAEVLATWTGSKLSFDGVKSLNSKVMQPLLGWSGSSLSFGGITELDQETAKLISQSHGPSLNFNWREQKFIEMNQQKYSMEWNKQTFDLTAFGSFANCQEAYNSGGQVNGVYQLHGMDNAASVTGSYQAYCDMSTEGGGWTRIIGTDSYRHDVGQKTSEIVSTYVEANKRVGVAPAFRSLQNFSQIMIKKTRGSFSRGEFAAYNLVKPVAGRSVLDILVKDCRTQANVVKNDDYYDGVRVEGGYTSHYSGTMYAGDLKMIGKIGSVAKKEGEVKPQYFFMCGHNESSDNDQSVLSFCDSRGDSNWWSDSGRGDNQYGALWSFWNGDAHTLATRHIGNGYANGFAGYKKGKPPSPKPKNWQSKHHGSYEIYLR